MPSENYRYYCLDGTGRLLDASWFYAASDEDAVAKITARHSDGKWEIWHEQRLVAEWGFSHRSDAFTQSQRGLADSRRLLRETAHLVRHQPRSGSEGDAR